MVFRKIWNNQDISQMSFENYSQSGSMIGGKVDVNVKIYISNDSIINDIRIGHNFYTTWAYEKSISEQGETVAECMARHNKKVEDIKEIVVYTTDTTGENEVQEVFSWTPTTGWKKISYTEVYY